MWSKSLSQYKFRAFPSASCNAYWRCHYEAKPLITSGEFCEIICQKITGLSGAASAAKMRLLVMVSIIRRDLFDYCFTTCLLSMLRCTLCSMARSLKLEKKNEWFLRPVDKYCVKSDPKFEFRGHPSFLLKPGPITISSCLGQACQTFFHSFAKINFSGCRWRAAVARSKISPLSLHVHVPTNPLLVSLSPIAKLSCLISMKVLLF